MNQFVLPLPVVLCIVILMNWVVAPAFCGIIAYRRGQPVLPWIACGFFIGVITLPFALLMRDRHYDPNAITLPIPIPPGSEDVLD